MKKSQIFNNQSGLSIIELMIALVISLIVILGMLQLISSTRQSYSVQINLSRLQEDARFLTDTITRELRMAHYAGFSSLIAEGYIHRKLVTEDNFAWHWTGAGTNRFTSLQGADAGAPPVALDPLPLAGTDMVVVRRLSERTTHLTADFDGGAVGVGTPAVLTVAGTWDGTEKAIDFADGDLLLFTDSKQAALGRLTSAPADLGDGDLFSLELGGSANTVFSIKELTGDFMLKAGAQVGKLITTLFYIGEDHVLYRKILVGGMTTESNPLTANARITQFELWYGVDTDTPLDGAPNTFLRPVNVSATDWDKVTSVRVKLSLESGSSDNSKVARDFISTINLRNQLQTE